MNNNIPTEIKKVSFNLSEENISGVERFNKKGVSVTLLFNKLLSHFIRNSYKPEYNDLNKELGLNNEGILEKARDIKIELLQRQSESELFAKFTGYTGKGLLIAKIPFDKKNIIDNKDNAEIKTKMKLILVFKIFEGPQDNITSKLLYVELSLVHSFADYLSIENALCMKFENFKELEDFLKTNQKDCYFTKDIADSMVLKYHKNESIMKKSLDDFYEFYEIYRNKSFEFKKLISY